MRQLLTQRRLMELFDYNPLTGIFISKVTRGPLRCGQKAGSATGHGYRKMGIDGVKHYEHHLAWLYVHGEYPRTIDHIDGNRCNNAIINLRVASHAQNCQNSNRRAGVSGLRGAYWGKRANHWFSKIQYGSTTRYLGRFNSAQEASTAYEKASVEIFGEFAVCNRNTQIEERC